MDTGASVAFRLRVVDLGWDDDGDEIGSCVIEPVEGPVEAPKPRSKARPLPPEYLRAIDFLGTSRPKPASRLIGRGCRT